MSCCALHSANARPAANRLALDRAATLIEKPFSNIFGPEIGSFDTVILPTYHFSFRSRLFLSSSASFVIVSFFFNSLLFNNNSWVHSFFLPRSGKSALPFLSGALKPVWWFPFVSRVREGVENETTGIHFASFCELLQRPLTITCMNVEDGQRFQLILMPWVTGRPWQKKVCKIAV